VRLLFFSFSCIVDSVSSRLSLCAVLPNAFHHWNIILPVFCWSEVAQTEIPHPDLRQVWEVPMEGRMQTPKIKIMDTLFVI
jgi:hypothetical protein